MNTWPGRVCKAHLMGESLGARMRLWRGAWRCCFALQGVTMLPSRLATHPARAAFGYLQLRFPGLKSGQLNS